MKEISMEDADITTVATWIAERSEHISNDSKSEEDSLPPAIKIIRCVLSLRTSYDKVVVRREKTFRVVHPDIKQVAELENLMASYPNPYEFMRQELCYKSERKAKMLQQVVQYVCQIVQKTPNVSEEEILKKWAIQAKPHECYTLKIKYFKLAGFQYLRMLFGADTAKPDVHVIRLVSKILRRNVSAIESILLLEEASKQVRLSVRSVDRFIWNIGARQPKIDKTTELNDELRPEYNETLLKNGVRGKYAEQYAAGTNLVRLDPDVADAFPTKEAVNEALRSVLKEKTKEK